MTKVFYEADASYKIVIFLWHHLEDGNRLQVGLLLRRNKSDFRSILSSYGLSYPKYPQYVVSLTNTKNRGRPPLWNLVSGLHEKAVLVFFSTTCRLWSMYVTGAWQGFFQKGKGVVNCATPKLPTRLTIRYLHDFFRRDLSSCRVLSLDSVFATWVMRFAFCRILSMGAQCSKTSPCLGLNAEVSEGSKQQVFELRSADFAKEEQSGHNSIFVAFWTQNHVRSQEVLAQLDGPSAKLYCSFPPSFFHTAINKYHQGLNNMNLSCNCWTAVESSRPWSHDARWRAIGRR